ncbi:504_t:CDS:2 [Cetraspora pellucida]|uniref:504_t:CDS:1 n=1 Tax=Cetraspora pellucida TaxID=1433469 RepID=A0ACA9K424_9GLOM|nr:504_t:CDS:2 [Cetraspora pellucida]
MSLWVMFFSDETRVTLIPKEELEPEQKFKKNMMKSIFRRHSNDVMLYQHDNATFHIAGVIKNYINNSSICNIYWPARSLRSKLLKRRVRLRRPSSLKILDQYCQEEWANIKMYDIWKYANTLTEKIKVVKEKFGKHTRY